MSVADDNSENDQWLQSIESGPKEVITTVMQVNDCNTRFRVDSAAGLHTICQKYVRKGQVTYLQTLGYACATNQLGGCGSESH